MSAGNYFVQWGWLTDHWTPNSYDAVAKHASQALPVNGPWTSASVALEGEITGTYIARVPLAYADKSVGSSINNDNYYNGAEVYSNSLHAMIRNAAVTPAWNDLWPTYEAATLFHPKAPKGTQGPGALEPFCIFWEGAGKIQIFGGGADTGDVTLGAGGQVGQLVSIWLEQDVDTDGTVDPESTFRVHSDGVAGTLSNIEIVHPGFLSGTCGVDADPTEIRPGGVNFLSDVGKELAAGLRTFRFLSHMTDINNMHHLTEWDDSGEGNARCIRGAGDTRAKDSTWGKQWNEVITNQTNTNGYAQTVGDGYILQIDTANAANVDLYLIFPTFPNDALVLDIIEAVEEGALDSGGTAHSPLDPNLRVYWEYSNEVWNAGTFRKSVCIEDFARDYTCREDTFSCVGDVDDGTVCIVDAECSGSALGCHNGINDGNACTDSSDCDGEPCVHGCEHDDVWTKTRTTGSCSGGVAAPGWLDFQLRIDANPGRYESTQHFRYSAMRTWDINQIYQTYWNGTTFPAKTAGKNYAGADADRRVWPILAYQAVNASTSRPGITARTTTNAYLGELCFDDSTADCSAGGTRAADQVWGYAITYYTSPGNENSSPWQGGWQGENDPDPLLWDETSQMTALKVEIDDKYIPLWENQVCTTNETEIALNLTTYEGGAWGINPSRTGTCGGCNGTLDTPHVGCPATACTPHQKAVDTCLFPGDSNCVGDDEPMCCWGEDPYSHHLFIHRADGTYGHEYNLLSEAKALGIDELMEYSSPIRWAEGSMGIGWWGMREGGQSNLDDSQRWKAIVDWQYLNPYTVTSIPDPASCGTGGTGGAPPADPCDNFAADLEAIDGWNTISPAEATATASLVFTATIEMDSDNGFVALNDDTVEGFDQIAIQLQCHGTSSEWVAYNGYTSSQTAENVVACTTVCKDYAVVITADVTNQEYTATVDGTVIAQDYGFRDLDTSLSYYQLWKFAAGDGIRIENVSWVESP